MLLNKSYGAPIAVASALVFSASSAVSVQAQETSGDFANSVTAFGAEEIAESSVSYQEMEDSSGLHSLVTEHVESEIRSGRTISAADVSVAVLNDADRGIITVTWDGDQGPDRLAISDVDAGDEGRSSAAGVRWPEGSGDFSSGGDGTGVGFETAINVDGFIEVAKDQCATIRFEPNYDSLTDHLLRTCYEKFHREDSTDWVYNRYSSFLPGEPGDGIRAQTVDFTIRSMPWEGEEGKVERIGEHTRGGNDADCEPGNFTFDLGPASLDIPIGTCSGTESLPNDDHNSMGVMWSGRAEEQIFVDAAVAVEASGSDVEPIYADYDWVEIIDCGYIPGIPCSTSLPEIRHDYLIHNDTGWNWPGE